MKAVFLDMQSLGNQHAETLDLQLDDLCRSVDSWQGYRETAPEQMLERMAGQDVVIVNKAVIDADMLAQLPDLKLICIAATGTNNVDLTAAREQGICVSNCQAYGTASVSQHVLTLMLALATRLLQYRDAVKAGAWQRTANFCLLDYPIMELSGKTLGIIGYGELGQGVARLASALGMKVLIAERPEQVPRPQRTEFQTVLESADVISLHCPLNAQTCDIIGAAELAAMKPGALLINAARGGIVNEQALVHALESGHLGGAAVDVLTEEPPRHGNPLLACQHPNLIVTPHCAWGSRESRQTIVDQLAEAIDAFRKGQPLRVVNAAKA